MNKNNNLIENKKKTAPAPQLKQSQISTSKVATNSIYVTKNAPKLMLLDGGVGVGKTTKIITEAIKTMLAGGVVVFAVHSKLAQVERSRELEAELKKIISYYQGRLENTSCPKIIARITKLKKLLKNIRMVASNSKDCKGTVASMFDSRFHELKEESSEGSTIFVTNIAVRKIDFSYFDPKTDLLVMDDDITTAQFDRIFSRIGQGELEMFNSCFDTKELDKSIFKIMGKSKKLLQTLDFVRKQGCSSMFVSAIKRIEKEINEYKNLSFYIDINKCEDGSFIVEKVEKLNSSIIANFQKVIVASENVKQDNISVFEWIQNGVPYDYQMLLYNSSIYGKKFQYSDDGKPLIKLASIAGSNTFTISRASSNGTIYKEVVSYLNNLPQYKDAHVSLNARIHENAFEDLNACMNITSTVTRGINSLQHCDLGLFYGVNKLDNKKISKLEVLYGMTRDDLEEQVTISALVQNIGRGVLRTQQSKPVLLVFPDNDTARRAVIRYARSYPELQPHVEQLLAEMEVICESEFSDSRAKYSDKGLSRTQLNRITYLKSVHGSEIVDLKIDELGLSDTLLFFKNRANMEKVLLKQVTRVAQKVKHYIKSGEVKQAANRLGLANFLTKVKDMSTLQVFELVVSTNPKNLKLTPVNKVEDSKIKYEEFYLPSMDHAEKNKALAEIDFNCSNEQVEAPFIANETMKAEPFRINSMH